MKVPPIRAFLIHRFSRLLLGDVTRVETINDTGRYSSAWDQHDVQLSLQDGGRTLKVFAKGGTPQAAPLALPEFLEPLPPPQFVKLAPGELDPAREAAMERRQRQDEVIDELIRHALKASENPSILSLVFGNAAMRDELQAFARACWGEGYLEGCLD